MSDLLKRADNCGVTPSIFLVRDLAKCVRKLEAEAYEAAAKVCDDIWEQRDASPPECAQAIRALIQAA